MNIDVFISHSSKDDKIANAICNTLEANNIKCWIAPRDIRPGSDWAESINNAIENSKAMVLVFSEYSNDSVQVAKELNLAVSNKLIILPFKIDETDPTGSMKYYLSDTHWLDAINGDMKVEIEKLKDVLNSLLPHNSGLIKKDKERKEETDPIEETPVLQKNLLKKFSFLAFGILLFGCLLYGFLVGNDNTAKELNITDIVALIEVTDDGDNVILDNDEITTVKKHYDNENGYHLSLSLSDEGQTKFFEYTSYNVSKSSKIYINKRLVSVSPITNPINAKEFLISGDFSEEDIERLVEDLHTEYMPEIHESRETDDIKKSVEPENAPQNTEIDTKTNSASANKKKISQKKCTVCGSTAHTIHSTCLTCGSTEHTTHPTCQVCGSTSHTNHPACPVCGSTSHASHPTCPVCGSTSHTSHPTCPVCGSTSHTSHPTCPICGSTEHTTHTQNKSACSVCGSKFHSIHPASNAPTINKDFD